MIDRKMSISEVLSKYPESMKVFEDFGLGCVGCEAALFENIEQGAQVHGVDINRLLDGLSNYRGMLNALLLCFYPMTEICSVILAAGSSRRLGFSKLL